MKKDYNKLSVVITGCSSGIGLETTKLFISKGYKVFGLSRKPFSLEGMVHVPCDVSDEESVASAVSTIMTQTSQIDILVNNAGMGISGSIENTPLSEAKKLFDINFFGTFLVTKAFLPYLKKGSKIINLGSVASRLPIAFQCFYSASKSAIEMFSDCLRMELKPFGIQVTTVLPGDTKTGFTGSRVKSQEENGRYSARVAKSVARMEKDEQGGMPALSVAKVIFSVSQKKRPPQSKVVGIQYKTIAFLNKILPKRFVNWVLFKMYG
ncbi:MAG: SDR family oxidoreductase [Clostridia bacterium]